MCSGRVSATCRRRRGPPQALRSRSSTTPRCSRTRPRRSHLTRLVIAAAIAAAIGILLLLQAAFRSWRLAVLVFLVLPLALVGGALAALIDGGGSRSARCSVPGAVRDRRAQRGRLIRTSSSSSDEGRRSARTWSARGTGAAAPILTTAVALGAGAAVRGARPRPGSRSCTRWRSCSGRPGHLDPAEPVPAARAVPALRGGHARAELGLTGRGRAAAVGQRGRRQTSGGAGDRAAEPADRVGAGAGQDEGGGWADGAG